MNMAFLDRISTEMEKVRDTGDISLLFFLAGANFWAILGHFRAILSHFGSFLGHFLVLIFLVKNLSLLFLLLFASLLPPPQPPFITVKRWQWLATYIQNAKNFADSAFQSKFLLNK